MATTKITDLTAYTDPINTDVLPIVDVTSDVTKKVSIANVMKNASLGSAAAPGISFDGDPNTGIYSPGANQVAISTDGTARLTASTTAITAAIPVDVLLGSASTPSYTFTGDLNTGIYSPGADQVAISTNGTGRLFVDASGRISVANQFTDSTLASNIGGLNVLTAGSSDNNALTFAWNHQNLTTEIEQRIEWLFGDDASANNYKSAGFIGMGKEGTWQGDSVRDSYLAFATTDAAVASEKVRITSAGQVGIGDSDPNFKLDVNGDVGIREDNNLTFHDGTGTAAFRIRGTSTNKLVFERASGNEHQMIIDDGKVGIGIANPATRLDLAESSGDCILGLSGQSSGRAQIRGVNTGSATTSELSFHTALAGAGTFERARITSSGQLLVGTSSARSNYQGGVAAPRLQVEGTDFPGSSAGYVRNSADANSSSLILGKTRGTTVNSNTIVSANDQLGQVLFQGADGTNLLNAARIAAEVDGTPGANDMPGRLVFSTTADGASSPSARLTIESTGALKLENGASNLYRPGGSGSGIGFSTNSTIPLNETGATSDNTENLGAAGTRWATVYAGTGTINTSDATLKQDVADLEQAELQVSSTIKGLIKKYRYIDAVANKGDDARIHVGVIAQEIEQAFVDEGLDPRRYALFCEDTLEDGSKRLGIRYDELLAFVIAAL